MLVDRADIFLCLGRFFTPLFGYTTLTVALHMSTRAVEDSQCLYEMR